MKRTENHPSQDLLELYLLNRTDETEEQEVEEHLLVCDECRVKATALEQEIDLIRSMLGPLQCTEHEPVIEKIAVTS